MLMASTARARKSALFTSAFALSLACGASAFAQTETAPTPAAAPQGQIQSQGLGDIVITAERRSASVQDTAAAVTAVTGEQIEALGITQPEDLAEIAPGIQGTKAGGSITQFYIRGVGNYAANAFAEAAVAFNQNGVYISRPGTYGGLFFDLERVEALKGPQGTLYGRNATGGALNLITKRPTLGDDMPSGNIGVEAGDYDLRRLNGALNLPLSDKAALRGAFQTVDRDGYLSDGYDDEETQSARISALFEPSERLSILIIGDAQHVGGKGGGGVITPFLTSDPWTGSTDPITNARLTGFSNRAAVGDPPGFQDIDAWGLSAEVNYDFGPVTLTMIPGYRDSSSSFRSYAPGFQIDVIGESAQQTSFEARLASNDTSPLEWVAGAFYFDEETTSEALYTQQLKTFLPNINLGENSTFFDLDLTTEAWALFGEATYSLTPNFRVTGGLRYTKEEKTLDGDSIVDPPELGPPGLPERIFPFVTTGDASWDATNWKVGVEYDLAPDNMVYFNVSTGFKAGGFYAEQASFGNTFEPEEITAYSLGSKNRFFDNRVQLNVEAFYWDYTDHQESNLTLSPGGYTLFVTRNVGQATIQGVDLEAQWRATDNDTFGFQLQYLDATFDEFVYTTFAPTGPPLTGCTASGAVPIFTVNCNGKEAIRAPEWSGTASYQHVFDFGDSGRVIGNLRTQFASETYVAIDYLESQRQESYTMSDASLTYETADGDWSIGAWVRNIEDEAVITNSFISPFTTITYSQLRAPRTYGVTLRASF